MKLSRIASICLAAYAIAASTKSLNAADFFYGQTTATQSYSKFIGPIPVTGLALNLPAESKTFNAALVTLNMPNLTLSNPTSPGAPLAATIQVVAPDSGMGLLTATATIGCNTCTSLPATQNVTIVVRVPLGPEAQEVMAEWSSNGNCTVTTQTFASISAVLVKE